MSAAGPEDARELPDHLRDALWRAESVQLARRDSPGGLVVVGGGEAGLAGPLAVAALGDRATRPIVVVAPPAASAESAVLLLSYSGEDEEALSAYAEAGARGARRVVATAGGRLAAAARADGVPVIPLPAALSPGAATVYFMVAVLAVAAACGAAPDAAAEVEAAAGLSERLLAAWSAGGSEASLPRSIAEDLAEHDTAVILGEGLATPAAERWARQLRGIAGRTAFAGQPDLTADFTAVLLHEEAESGAAARERSRPILDALGLQAETIVGRCARGETRTERLLSLVLLGDLVALALAEPSSSRIHSEGEGIGDG